MKKGDILHEKRDLGEGKFYEQDWKVNWVIDEEAAVTMVDDLNAHKIINTKDLDFIVLVDSAPSFQSQVESMTEEELRASVEELRAGRVPITVTPKVKKEKAPKQSVEEKQLEMLLGNMSPEQVEEMKKKLGL